MKWTALAEGVNLASGETYTPGDQKEWAEKNCRPLIDIGAAVEGHIDITEKAARLCRTHEIDPTGVEGTGAGGRILADDVRAILEPADEEEE